MRRLCVIAVAAALFATPAFAASAKSYQVIGPVIGVGSDTITVQKGIEKWQINTPTPSGLKVGDKVAVEYTMTATKITVKDDKKK